MSPFRYPVAASDVNTVRAFEQTVTPSSDMTSVGEKEESNEAIRVANKEGEVSWRLAAVTRAAHSLDLG
jgi:hypothetical protein